MSNFSKNPQDALTANINADFLGVLVERGVPVLDRDLNLRSDLHAELFRRVLEQHIGSGTPGGSYTQFAIVTCGANDFTIQPGSMLVAGVEITLTAPLKYSEQAALHPGLSPALTALAANPNVGFRFDQIYVDVWFDEIDSAMDTDSATDLYHRDTYEIETSVRLKPNWVVRVAQDVALMPSPAPGHRHASLAYLQRPQNVATIDVNHIHDLRITDLDMPTQAAQINDGIDTFLKLCDWLGPQFDAAKPLSSTSAHKGMSITISGANLDLGEVTIELGVHKPEGPSFPIPKPTKLSGQQKGRQAKKASKPFQQVEVAAAHDASPAQAVAMIATTATLGLTPVPGLTEAQAQLLSWTEVPIVGDPTDNTLTFIVPAGLDGWVYVAVDNTASRAYVQRPFYVYGPPVWAKPGSQLKTYRGTAAHVNDSIALMGTFFDIPDTVVEYAPTGSVDKWEPCTVSDATALGCTVKGPGYAGEYMFRVKNFASDTPVVSSDTIKVTKA